MTERGAALATRPAPLLSLLGGWLAGPVPIERVELVRILAPLATLGFMASRAVHADEWLGEAGFRVPDLGSADHRQPFYLAPLHDPWPWVLAAALVASGLSLSAGFRTKASGSIFAACLVYVALADRLAAFTVSKLSPVVALALVLGPAGARYSVDAWVRARRGGGGEQGGVLPTRSTAGTVRFFQLLLPVFYCASGVCKARGDWLSHPQVLFTHLHDSYQTSLSWALANGTPAWAWTLLQGVVLALELLAPLWFGWARSRPFALAAAIGMHLAIGLMFGPVRYFSALMIALLLGAFLPEPLLARAGRLLSRLDPPAPPAPPASSRAPGQGEASPTKRKTRGTGRKRAPA
jgi:hypothetical protein